MSSASELRPISVKGFVPVPPAEQAGAPPVMDWIEIVRLFVDHEYQRFIRADSRKNIRRIATAFRWSSFTPVVVASLSGDRYAIIDGQHRTTAALLAGFDKVPCYIVAASRALQARSFAEINSNLTRITRQALHTAGIAAGDEAALAILDVCQRADVEVLRYPVQTDQQKPGQTMAVGCLAKALRQHGRDILVTALQCVTQTENNIPGILIAHVINGLCALLADRPHWLESGEKLLQAFDQVDISGALDLVRNGRRPYGNTIAGELAKRLRPEVEVALAELEVERAAKPKKGHR